MSEQFLVFNWSDKLNYFSMNAAFDWSIRAIICVRNVSTSLISLPTVSPIWINSTSNQNHSTCIPICNAMRAGNSFLTFKRESTFCLNTPCGTLQWIRCNPPRRPHGSNWRKEIKFHWALLLRAVLSTLEPDNKSSTQYCGSFVSKRWTKNASEQPSKAVEVYSAYIPMPALVRLANAFRFHTGVAGKAKERFSIAAGEPATGIMMSFEVDALLGISSILKYWKDFFVFLQCKHL